MHHYNTVYPNIHPPPSIFKPTLPSRFIPTLDASSILVPSRPADPYVPRDAAKMAAMTRRGLPTAPASLRTYDEFILSFDNRTRNPIWVFEHLTKVASISNQLAFT